jgi:ATP-dependent Lhr-like helicase
MGPLLRRQGLILKSEEGVTRWWTFAGGRINYTLKYALEILTPLKVTADNFLLRIEGANASTRFQEAYERLRTVDFRSNPETGKAILARLPQYRLSKFQDALPTGYATEMVGEYLLDFEGAEGFAG